MTTACLPLERLGHAAPPALADRRAAMDAAIHAGLWRTDPPAEALSLAGVRTLAFRPTGPSRATLLHCHGGAFRIGSPEVVAPFAAALAARCSVTVLCPAYRLAPEHPFPAGLRDAWAALSSLRCRSEPILLSGDSAGGAIAVALAKLALDGGFSIAGLALLSPWLDLAAGSASYRSNADRDPLFSTASATEAAEQYLQGTPASHPLASPLHGNVAGLPPCHISVGDGEVLLDDAVRFYNKLRNGGIPSDFHCITGMDHVAITRNLALPGAAMAFDDLARFIDNMVAP